jgi:AGZA family xanthine/uracil permease-like MFS transporter
MAYIIFVQPAVLSMDFAGRPTGLDFGAVLLATCLASGLTTIFMGLWANYPIALGPGMGENFFFVSVIMSLAAAGVAEPWRAALGLVFVSGVIFLALSLLGVREAIIDAISPNMRNGIAVGVGLFIAFIGLRNAGIVVPHAGTAVAFAPNLVSADTAVFAVGLIVAGVLQIWKLRGAILWGILAAAAVALAEAAQRQGAGDRLSVVPDGRTAARVLRPDPLSPRSINASPQRDTEEIQRGKSSLCALRG